MAYKVAYRPKARSDLREIYRWIAGSADAQTAAGYVGRVQAACVRLVNFPNRGSPREDLEPGLRNIAFEGRATIYYRVETGKVRIVRILAAGRDPRQEFHR